MALQPADLFMVERGGVLHKSELSTIVPSGGDGGDVLTKQSASDFDYDWAAPSGGGSGLTQPQVMARSLGC